VDLPVLLVIAQTLVFFHGYQLLVIRLPDDRVAVSFRTLCLMLNLARNKQVQRIQRDPNLAEQLFLARVDTPRGPRYMDFLIVEAIPAWLIGLHFNNLAPEKRPLFFCLACGNRRGRSPRFLWGRGRADKPGSASAKSATSAAQSAPCQASGAGKKHAPAAGSPSAGEVGCRTREHQSGDPPAG